MRYITNRTEMMVVMVMMMMMVVTFNNAGVQVATS